ncbi:MAG: 3-isopropylmalate dehydratase large subunit [Archaeoglobi archaeon]|nr:3-isopropylmalate dehydratase large subunit [Candidatus Mnemosynella bozhongmuii]
MSLATEILSKAAGRKVEPGEIIEVPVDYVMVNDVTAPPAAEEFEKLGVELWDRERIVVILDHYMPNVNVRAAEMTRFLREWVKKRGIKNFYPEGRNGVCHQLMIEEGFVAPGRIIVGADSHTCSYGALGAFATGIGSTEAAGVFATGEIWFRVPETQHFKISGRLQDGVMGKDLILTIIGDIGVSGSLYKAQEFSGEAISSMSLSDRITVCNMAVEAGAKTGIMEPDEKVLEYLRGRVRGDFQVVRSDGVYEEEYEYDASEIVPVVAEPHLPENVKPAEEVDVEIQQAYLGSCTNGRLEDLRIAARILKGRKVHPDVRMIVVPASKRVYESALKEGLIDIILEADAYVAGWTCGACIGAYMGVLGKGERCISSTNRNFIGRMGHPESEVYLASPATVAASAVEGKITDPRKYLR